jgi:hypothetical protein
VAIDNQTLRFLYFAAHYHRPLEPRTL